MPRWTSWAGTVRAHPSRIVRPRSADEAARAVRGAGPWRPVGRGLCATPLAATDALLVDATGLDHVGRVDPNTSRVRVGGGATIGAVARALAAQGYRLPPVGTSAYPTVGGGLATALHGTGREHGSLSDARWTRAVSLLLPSGERCELSEERPADAPLLAAARAHLGALGLVLEVELAVERGAGLRVAREPLPVDALADPAVRASAAHVEAWWVPFTEVAQVIRRDQHPSAVRRRGEGARRLLGEDLPLRALIAAVQARPAAAPAAMRALARVGVGRGEVVGRWDGLALGPRRLRATDAEWALPADALPAAIAALRAVDAPWHLPVNLRWTRADEGALLSPAAGRDTLWFDVGWHPAVPGGEAALAALDQRLRALGGRPHWGKRRGEDGAWCAALPAFEAARRQLDPEGALLNAPLRRILGHAAAGAP